MAEAATGLRWTPEQWLGITTTGRSLLVSAAAGSGKTAVLAARCAHLVCDAHDPCGVDELLVVTFTENAAAEMKSRIQQALSERLAKRQSPRLARQLALIDRAQVSTLHGFCSRLLRRCFHLRGLDPNFAIIDGDEAALLRLEIARELFQQRYAQDESGEFHRLIDAYGDGNDQRLIQQVIRTHEMLCSLVDPAGWRATARQRIAEAAERPIEASSLGRELITLTGSRLAALRRQCGETINAVSAMDGFGKYVDWLAGPQRIIEHWEQVLREHGLDALAGEVDVDLPRLPTIPSTTPGKQMAKACIDALRAAMDKSAFRESLKFTRDEWREGLRRTLPHVEVFLALVERFGHEYQKAKKATRSLDFSDLERETLAILHNEHGSPSQVALWCHGQYRHVLVDEYQDINEVQDAILRLVSRECLGESGRSANLFCVGDVKQSIYRFRLAEPGRFLEREQRFRAAGGGGGDGGAGGAGAGQVIDLQANFRSRGPLLRAINEVFARLMTSKETEIIYDAAHHLHPGMAYPDGDGMPCFSGAPIELHLLPDKIDDAADDDHGAADGPEDDDADEMDLDRTGREAMLLVQRIRRMMGLAGGQRMHVIEKGPHGLRPRPIRYGDIVILLRSLKYKADQYAEVLRLGGIPVRSESGSGYFDSMEVRDMVSLLCVLDNRRQDIPLAAVLRSPLAKLPDPEDSLARIRLAYPGKAVAFHEAVIRYAGEQDDELAAKLRDILNRLDEWRDLARQRPLAELIWLIYDQTGYLAFCSALENGEQRSANLLHLHERARQFGTFQRQGLGRFIQFLEKLRSETDLGQPAVASEADDVVRIMSVHRSKGLEFPVVLLPDLGKNFNLGDCRGSILADRQGLLGMSVVDEDRRIRYPSLASMLAENRLRRAALAEELRVLYVAMTRAREHLILIGTCSDRKLDHLANRRGDRDRPLPAEEVLGARCMLDWIAPVALGCGFLHGETGGPASGAIRISRHTSQQIRAWPPLQEVHPLRNEKLAGIIDLQPLNPPPPPDAAADAIIDRLSFTYAHSAFASLPAAQSVTAWTRQSRTLPIGIEGEEPPRRAPQATLPLPRSLSDDLAVTGLERGSAAHLVLQHLDFTRPCDDADLQHQIDQLRGRKLITAAQAEAVDTQALSWLMQSEAGALLRSSAAAQRRELPFYFAADPGVFGELPRSETPMDRVMVRGRIDVLVPSEQGWIILDYKTDRISPDDVTAHAELYRPQVDLYRQAIEQITRRPVAAVHLIFLHPRLIHRL